MLRDQNSPEPALDEAVVGRSVQRVCHGFGRCWFVIIHNSPLSKSDTLDSAFKNWFGLGPKTPNFNHSELVLSGFSVLVAHL